ncbi:mCG141120, partial [Mus musculus]
QEHLNLWAGTAGETVTRFCREQDRVLMTVGKRQLVPPIENGLARVQVAGEAEPFVSKAA